VVELDGGRAEVGARQRQELTGEKGNVGERAPVKDWRRGGVVELQRGAVKHPMWSFGTMGGSKWGLRGGEEEGGGGGVLDSGRLEIKRASGMGRKGASATLEPEKRGRGGVHRQLLRRRGGTRTIEPGRGARVALGLGNDAWKRRQQEVVPGRVWRGGERH
jgi:hypothetical protein